MQENLLIVFAKNKTQGKVKTRLAETIGEQGALEVYEYLFHLTERETQKVKDVDLAIYFTDQIDQECWINAQKYIQTGKTLGDRMKQAFEEGFKQGYQNILGIGTDLPDLSAEIIESGFKILNSSDFVFGPADDGGYYLIGMKNIESLFVFDDKPWSTENLLEITIKEIKSKKRSVDFLEELNDIDRLEDLKISTISERFKYLFAK